MEEIFASREEALETMENMIGRPRHDWPLIMRGIAENLLDRTLGCRGVMRLAADMRVEIEEAEDRRLTSERLRGVA